MNKSLLILPNKNIEREKPFYISNLKNHAVGMKTFSDLYNLNIKPEDMGDKKDELFGPHWADKLTKFGNVVVLFDFMTILYIPTEISLKQLEWLEIWKNFFYRTEDKVRAIIYHENSEEYISYGDENLSKVDYIYNKIYEKLEKKDNCNENSRLI